MYYKCLQPQYYVQGKVIDTNVDNYGESFRNEYVDIKKGAKFILNSASETGLPLSLFYFMLAHANNVPLARNIEIAKVLSGNQNSRINNGKYSINELVGCSSSSQTVKYETLLEYFNKAKKIDWKFGNNGSLLWEYAGEKIRNEFFPFLPSRLKSYFLFRDFASANYYLENHKQKQGSIIVKAELLKPNVLETFDMKIWDINNNNVPYAECEKNIKAYWKSRNLNNCQVPEVLFQGKLRLLEQM